MLLYVIGSVLGVLLLVLLLLVVLPLFVHARYERGREGSLSSLSLLPFAGLLGLRFSAGSAGSRTELLVLGRAIHAFRPSKARVKVPEKKEKKPKARPPKKPARPLSERIAWFKRLLSVSGPRVFPFLRRLSKAFRIKYLRYDIALGLGDPASTGQLFGLVQCVVGGLDTKKIRGVLKPDFQNQTMQGTLNLRAAVSLHRIMAAVIVFAAPVLWRLGVDYLKEKWHRRWAATPRSTGAHQPA